MVSTVTTQSRRRTAFSSAGIGADLGAAKPELAAFERAHQRIELVTGEQLDPHRIAFLDDSARHVSGAREFGWVSVEHRTD